MDRAPRTRRPAGIAPISHRHDWIKRGIDRTGHDRSAWAGIYRCPTGRRYSRQRIRLGAPRLASRPNTGIARARQTYSSRTYRNAMIRREAALVLGACWNIGLQPVSPSFGISGFSRLKTGWAHRQECLCSAYDDDTRTCSRSRPALSQSLP